jgi:hypothetical protein
MDDAADQSNTAPNWLGLLSQVQAFAATNGLTAAAVAAKLLSLLSNDPPADADANANAAEGAAAAPPPPAPSGHVSLLMMSPARRVELREKNLHNATNAPPVPFGEALAFLKRKRTEIVAAAAAAHLPEAAAMLLAELSMSHVAWLGGSLPLKAEIMALRALMRAADAPGSMVRKGGLLGHVYPLINAIDAASDHRPGLLLKQLPPSREREADRPPASTGAIMTALTGCAMEGMLLGGVMHGAVTTQEIAEQKVRAAFAREGITLAVRRPRKDQRMCNRLENAAARGEKLSDDERSTLEIFRAAMKRLRHHAAGGWPLPAREAWLAGQVAAEARRSTA